MGLTKTQYYTEEQLQLSRMMKVMGHPARIAILQSIIKTKTCVCGDLVTEIGLAQSTVSQHLKELKDVGLIQGTIEGTSMCYCINVANWNKLNAQTNNLFNSANCTDLACC
ncbi:MAG: metalloregulator ArsR/SmtB family transcription factor [Crocinitomicaceae bacterium]|nr:metalloregulator ArsR/SmtB family transcription factor [Crocinitomicaceae bacterium]MDG1776186.1 metalloregulator ArsR/SmtB family transcription factor [Crocinitomicaceae bacterium]